MPKAKKTMKKPVGKPKAKKPARPPKKTEEEIARRRANAPQTLRGMKDILPVDQSHWNYVRSSARKLAREFGYHRIDTPIMEETALFLRGVGKQTDIVEKEMYSFVDQGEDKITLRPEATAAIARAYINHGMWNQPQPVKLFYIGPMFRHEKPQRGRYRQLHQAGFEVIGSDHPVVDAQLAHIAYLLFKEMGLDTIVHINSIGDLDSRAQYKEELVNHYRSNRSQICDNCKKRITRNPLRLLDCKEEGCVAVRSEAPQIVDYLNESSKNHFVRVLEYLDELEVPYQLNPHLVRGLDYYDHTVFEIMPAGEGNNLALGGGGRYNGLVELLGGEPAPACGFSWGLDRAVLYMKEQEFDVPDKGEPDVFLAQLGEPARRQMLALFNEMRAEGMRVVESFAKDSLKHQLEAANKADVRFTLILGQKEVLDGTVLIRDMHSGIQEAIDFKKIIPELKKKLSTPRPSKPKPVKPEEPEEKKESKKNKR